MKVSKETVQLKAEELENDGVEGWKIIPALVDFFGSLPVIN